MSYPDARILEMVHNFHRLQLIQGRRISLESDEEVPRLPLPRREQSRLGQCSARLRTQHGKRYFCMPHNAGEVEQTQVEIDSKARQDHVDRKLPRVRDTRFGRGESKPIEIDLVVGHCDTPGAGLQKGRIYFKKRSLQLPDAARSPQTHSKMHNKYFL